MGSISQRKACSGNKRWWCRTVLLHRSVHVKCVSFKSRSTSCKTTHPENVTINEDELWGYGNSSPEVSQLCYLTGLFFFQHYWYGILKNFLIPMLGSNNSGCKIRVILKQNKTNWTVFHVIYHSNICLPQELHNVNNPDRRQLSVSWHKLFLNQSVWVYSFLSTCLPSLRHCEEDPFSSLEVNCCEFTGQSCRLGFSNFKALKSLMSGRYTVPSWASHRKTTMDRGQPFSRDRTTPAWKWDLSV